MRIAIDRILLPIAATLLVLLVPAGAYDVAVVPSDATQLRQQIGRSEPLKTDQITAMTRRAVNLVGGMAAFVESDAKLVAIKANISILEPSGSGVVTDARVVRAVALLVHEVAPQAKILIVEGAGGWVSPALRDCTDARVGNWIHDGFAVAGHRNTEAELQSMGIDIECFDLNFDRAYELRPEGGGLAHQEYSIAATIIDADTWINVPVAKTHGAKITCSLKNPFGILPGTIYGWSKANGTAHHGPMPHSPRVLDEAWVDLYEVSRVDLNVVDMIAGSEAGAFEEDHTHRSNMILAGANPIATDLVVARLMGFNPDDFEFAALAARQGLGPRFIEDVNVHGVEGLQPLVSRWKKAGVAYGSGDEWAAHANYGMGPREWTLLGLLPRDHIFAADTIEKIAPVPGEDGWSPVVWFGHDLIDLDKQFDDPTNSAVYAYTNFTMTTSDSVRFWFGSDEEMSVWLDGDLLYEHKGRRRHRLGMVKLPGYVEAGEHRLLVRAGQGRGDFDFSFNICEPIDDVLYHGNRYPGVRYHIGPAGSPAMLVVADDVGDDGSERNEYNASTIDLTDPLVASRTAPDTIIVDGIDPSSDELLGLLLELAHFDSVDAQLVRAMGNRPFSLAYGGRGRESRTPPYGPDFSRLLGWLGLEYAVYYGSGSRESLKTIQGLLAQGYVPVTSTMERSRRRRFGGPQASKWMAIDGFRRDGDIIEIRQAGAGRWLQVSEDWVGTLPSGNRENCPLLVARRGSGPLSATALVDTLAALALELGGAGQIVDEVDWGHRIYPTGLAAWDAWVTDWERRPFTLQWATSPRPLDQLEGLRRRVLIPLIAQRQLAARFFASAATSATGSRQPKLQAAATGYAAVAQRLETLVAYMPSEDRLDDLPAEDLRRLDRIVEARPLLRDARDAERSALNALRTLVGSDPLPSILEDAWHRREEGVKLFTWRAVTDETVFNLVYLADELAPELLHGNEITQMSIDVHHAMPQLPGWQVVLETGEDATGLYSIIEQPSAANGWRVVVRADDERVWRDNAPELVVWAVPGEKTQEVIGK
ncbi:MAG: DUF362 domain-containing protein [Gemmatimonadetes bacterium]|nr:DUF362 domain-containing protein [Gemmatimonadota bacterium]